MICHRQVAHDSKCTGRMTCSHLPDVGNTKVLLCQQHMHWRACAGGKRRSLTLIACRMGNTTPWDRGPTPMDPTTLARCVLAYCLGYTTCTRNIPNTLPEWHASPPVCQHPLPVVALRACQHATSLLALRPALGSVLKYMQYAAEQQNRMAVCWSAGGQAQGYS